MTPAQYKLVEQHMDASIGPIETYEYLIIAFPSIKVIQKDVYNARDKIKFEKLQGRTRVKALLHELEAQGDKWNVSKRLNLLTGEITGLMFSLVHSLSIWKSYPLVMQIDATYKVNRYNVPLLSIVGTTGLNTTFYVANIFLAGKHKDDYI
jgi:hypothetical protein